LSEGARFLKIPRKSKKKEKRSFSKFTRKLQILPQNLGGAKPYCCPPPLSLELGRGVIAPLFRRL